MLEDDLNFEGYLAYRCKNKLPGRRRMHIKGCYYGTFHATGPQAFKINDVY